MNIVEVSGGRAWIRNRPHPLVPNVSRVISSPLRACAASVDRSEPEGLPDTQSLLHIETEQQAKWLKWRADGLGCSSPLGSTNSPTTPQRCGVFRIQGFVVRCATCGSVFGSNTIHPRRWSRARSMPQRRHGARKLTPSYQTWWRSRLCPIKMQIISIPRRYVPDLCKGSCCIAPTG